MLEKGIRCKLITCREEGEIKGISRIRTILDYAYMMIINYDSVETNVNEFWCTITGVIIIIIYIESPISNV